MFKKEIPDSQNRNTTTSTEPNPYNLFLILILLINSYGIATSLKNMHKSERENAFMRP